MMAQARTIELLLSNGSLSGLIRAELSKWNGVMLVSPRESYYLLNHQQEANFWGIYLLLSEEKVYIGQSSELLKRTKEHDASLQKDWWNRVVLLSTTNDWLNRSHIDYLETIFIQRAKEVGSLAMENRKSGNSYKISPFEEAKLNDYIEGALLLIELIGINVFTKKVDKGKPVPPGTPKPVPPVSNKMTKGKAQAIFESRGTLKKYDIITFASLQKLRNHYWANPSPEVLKKNWYIILNNTEENKLYLLNVPKNTFYLENDLQNGFVVRKDRNKLDILLLADNLVEKQSNVSLKEYVIDTIEY